MTPERLILRNASLTAVISRQTGALLQLFSDRVPNVLNAFGCRWKNGNTNWSEEKDLKRATIDPRGEVVTVTYAAAGLNVERTYRLTPASPLLEVTVSVWADQPGTSITEIGLPHVALTSDFAGAFEDEADLYFDGEEVGGGHELPPWRVFFRQDHQTGLLVATRSKLQMSHLQIYDRSFDIRPHVMTAYSTDYVMAHSALTFVANRRQTATFELGPWEAARHAEFLDHANLHEPVAVGSPPPTGRPPADMPGVILNAVDIAPAEAVSASFAPDKWLKIALPWCRSPEALVCGPSVKPPSLTVSPGLSGIYRVYAGLGNGTGIEATFSKDPMPTLRTIDGEGGPGHTPFNLYLSGDHQAREVLLSTTQLDGQTITVDRFHNSYATTVLDYLRFEQLTPEEAANWRARRAKEPPVELSGFNDIPDIARFTDARDPDPNVYAANLWEHANCRITKVFWRIDGQCSDFPSKVNTLRYVSAKVHGLFHPQAKAYGRAQRKVDMLELAVNHANQFGLKLYGWMRFNNYGGNVQSAFFRDHPQFHEEWESGHRANKLCLGFPEVRQHKIDILVEAAQYGLHGICLGFLRHPPILCYHPMLVDGFRDLYGRRPPRRRNNPDQLFVNSRPPASDEHQRWYAFRAAFMTTFMRDLKAALRDAGRGDLPIAIWVRPNHCLFDGIDLPTWLDEGLVDEVVADDYNNPSLCEVDPEWKQMVQAKARLIRGVSGFDFDRARKMLPVYLKQGYDGISTYESDFTVVQDNFRRLYDDLRE